MPELQSHDAEVGAAGSRSFVFGETVDPVTTPTPPSAWSRSATSASLQAASADHAAGPRKLFRYRVIKRFLDVAVILALSPVLLLLVGLVAAAVRLTRKGPSFSRIGAFSGTAHFSPCGSSVRCA